MWGKAVVLGAALPTRTRCHTDGARDVGIYRSDYAARPHLDRYESEGLGDEDDLGDASDEHAARLRADAALDARARREDRAQGTGRGRHLPGIIADGVLHRPPTYTLSCATPSPVRGSRTNSCCTRESVCLMTRLERREE